MDYLTVRVKGKDTVNRLILTGRQDALQFGKGCHSLLKLTVLESYQMCLLIFVTDQFKKTKTHI